MEMKVDSVSAAWVFRVGLRASRIILYLQQTIHFIHSHKFKPPMESKPSKGREVRILAFGRICATAEDPHRAEFRTSLQVPHAEFCASLGRVLTWEGTNVDAKPCKGRELQERKAGKTAMNVS